MVSSGVVASTTSSPLASGATPGLHMAAPPCTTQVSVAPHAGLQAETQVPETHVKPSRHAGVHVAVLLGGVSLLHAASASAAAKTAPWIHPKDEGLMHNGYHGARCHGKNRARAPHDVGPSRTKMGRDRSASIMVRDVWRAIGLLIVAGAGGCLPDVDFTPCEQRGNCPWFDVPDGAADRPGACLDATLCDAASDDGPPMDAALCIPACRVGYTCVSGGCVSACNPACLPTEACVVQGGAAMCVPNVSPDASDVVDASDALSMADGSDDASEGAAVDVLDASDAAVADASEIQDASDSTDAVADLRDAAAVDRDDAADAHDVADVECFGLTNCGGVCIDVFDDPLNCGACGLVCTMGRTCNAGNCVCEPIGHSAVCDGECRDLWIETQHCGSCGNACPSGQVCRRGTCVTP